MNTITALFDFDGTLMNTEPNYRKFWTEQGKRYCGREDIGDLVRGSTLKQIHDNYLPQDPAIQHKIVVELDAFETTMPYDYINGAESFIKQLKENNIKTAVVTSSNNVKMRHVYAAHPELLNWFDAIVTAEDYNLSKPNPDCFLSAAAILKADTTLCVVFEDSLFGLQAARNAKMKCVALATSLPTETLKNLADMVIEDFSLMDIKTIEKLFT